MTQPLYLGEKREGGGGKGEGKGRKGKRELRGGMRVSHIRTGERIWKNK